jgi:hypothetical protein
MVFSFMSNLLKAKPENLHHSVMSLTELERMLWERTRDSQREQSVLTDGKIWIDVGISNEIDSVLLSRQAAFPFLKRKLEANTVYDYHTHPHVFPSTKKPLDMVSPPSALDLYFLRDFTKTARYYGKKAHGRIVERFGVWDYWPRKGSRDLSYDQAARKAAGTIDEHFNFPVRKQALLVTEIYRRAQFNVRFTERNFA